MSENCLPGRLTELISDVGAGAFVKRMSDDAKGILVDFDVEQNQWLVVMAKRRFREDGGEKVLVPSKPNDYVVKCIKDSDEWLVLTDGGDFVLID